MFVLREREGKSVLEFSVSGVQVDCGGSQTRRKMMAQTGWWGGVSWSQPKSAKYWRGVKKMYEGQGGEEAGKTRVAGPF